MDKIKISDMNTMIPTKEKRWERILILGAGKMGAFFTDILSCNYETAVYDVDPHRLRFLYNTQRFASLEEIDEFKPQLVINAVSLKHTIEAFHKVLPHLTDNCMLSDIASVKSGLKEFYDTCGHPFASTHPMFGPTFANLGALSNENAVIITEGDVTGKNFFRNLYQNLNLHICEYTFDEHDENAAYALSLPYLATFAFCASTKPLDAPGTTFKRHLHIAQGVLGEDEELLREILFTPYTCERIRKMREELTKIQDIIENQDDQKLHHYLEKMKESIK